MKQKQMEALLIENRVRKLKHEDQRLHKQIAQANYHSNFADSVRQRKEEEQRLWEQMAFQEAERIKRQHSINEANRKQTMNRIA